MSHLELGLSCRNRPQDAGFDVNEIRPHGRFGVGLITGHPVGLVFAVGIVLIGLEALPEARVFFITSVPLGALFGLFLWLRHR